MIDSDAVLKIALTAFVIVWVPLAITAGIALLYMLAAP